MAMFGRKMSAVGAGMTKYLTVPLAAVGAVSVKMAADYSRSMTRIQALTGMSAEQMSKYSAAIERMAGVVGKAPKELAEGLYFIASSGFEGAEALSVLEASAKASSAGLGDVQTVADAVTSVVMAYGKENITAAQAVDVLTAAVREGKAEPEELAASLGNVISTAKILGVEFNQTAASIATMTLAGVETPEAITALNQAMLSLAKPTQEGRKLADDLGLSYAGLRDQLADEGVIEVFRTLQKATHGNIEQLTTLMPNVRGLKALLALTGVDAKKVSKVFDEVTNSTGDMSSAFKTWAESDGGKVDKALADLQVAGIKIGSVLLPTVVRAAQWVGKLAQSFGNLSEGTQGFIVKIGAVAAAAGPLLFFGGKIITLLTTIGPLLTTAASMVSAFFAAFQVGGFGALAGSITAALGPIGLVIAAVAGIGVGLVLLYKHSETFRNIVSTAFRAVATAAGWVWDKLKEGWQYISKTLGPAFADLWSAIVPRLRQVGQMIAVQFRLIASAVSAVVGFIRKHWDTIGPIVKAAWKIVTTVSRAAVRALAQVIRLIADVIRGDWKGAWAHLKQIAKINASATQVVVGAMKTILIGLMKAAARGMVAALRALPGLMAAAGRAALRGLLSAVTAGIAANIAMLRSVPGRVQAVFAGAAGWLVSAGAAILSGLLSGMQSMVGRIIGEAASIASQVKNAIAGALGINSPSRVTYEQGQQIGKGLALGISSTRRGVVAAATTLAHSATVPITPSGRSGGAMSIPAPARAAQVMRQAGLSASAPGKSAAPAADAPPIVHLTVNGNVYGVDDLVGLVTDGVERAQAKRARIRSRTLGLAPV